MAPCYYWTEIEATDKKWDKKLTNFKMYPQ